MNLETESGESAQASAPKLPERLAPIRPWCAHPQIKAFIPWNKKNNKKKEREQMQAIETKYIPATNYRGSRIKASCERGSITVSYDCALNSEEAHIAAVKALVAKFVKEDEKRYGTNNNPWSKPFVTGGLKKTYVHVYLE